MNAWDAILLGIVQGLGEFLPISSSAHLVIVPWLLNFSTPGLSFDVALHFGTLIALLAYFFKDWVILIRSFFSSLRKRPAQYSHDEKMIWYILIGTIPAAIVGLTVEEYAETIFRNPIWIGINMMVFGILLFLVDRLGKKTKKMGGVTLWDAIWVGLAQCLALVPGTSRSGVTITAGMMNKMDRTTAAKFSFLLSTPAVAGAAVLKADDFFANGWGWNSVLGIVVSGVVGYYAIKYMLYFLRNYTFLVYVIYRLLFAAGVFLALAYKG